MKFNAIEHSAEIFETERWIIGGVQWHSPVGCCFQTVYLIVRKAIITSL